MASAKTKAAGPATKGLRVVARREVFRRAGRVFTAEATTIPLSELSDDDVDALKAEPQLVVSEVDIEPAAQDKKAA